jgi:hypothetical protein
MRIRLDGGICGLRPVPPYLGDAERGTTLNAAGLADCGPRGRRTATTIEEPEKARGRPGPGRDEPRRRARQAPAGGYLRISRHWGRAEIRPGGLRDMRR